MTAALQRRPTLSLFEVALRVANGQAIEPSEARAALIRLATEPASAACIDRIRRRAVRDLALLQAAQAIRNDHPGILPWQVAKHLAGAIARFDAGLWPRVRAGGSSPSSAVFVSLETAFLTGERLPKTPRALYSLIVAAQD